jgi:hypothetical protein
VIGGIESELAKRHGGSRLAKFRNDMPSGDPHEDQGVQVHRRIGAHYHPHIHLNAGKRRHDSAVLLRNLVPLHPDLVVWPAHKRIATQHRSNKLEKHQSEDCQKIHFTHDGWFLFG